MEIFIIPVLLVSLLIMVMALSVLIYHQSLLFNEINKRLLGIAVESINYARESYEDTVSRLESLTAETGNSAANENVSGTSADNDDLPFDPHSYVPIEENEI